MMDSIILYIVIINYYILPGEILLYQKDNAWKITLYTSR